MAESHHSLREDYQVSCAELDTMVEIAKHQQGVYGARMTGGGFGGCTINLVRADDVPVFREQVAKAYQAGTGRKPDIYVCKASDGAVALNASSGLSEIPSGAIAFDKR
jgi:galactokinase